MYTCRFMMIHDDDDDDDDDDEIACNPRSILWQFSHSDKWKLSHLVKLPMASLQAYFASLPSAMLSLFMSISGADLYIDHVSQENREDYNSVNTYQPKNMGWNTDSWICYFPNLPTTIHFNIFWICLQVKRRHGFLCCSRLCLCKNTLRGGVSWEEVIWPLAQISHLWVVIYLFYVQPTHLWWIWIFSPDFPGLTENGCNDQLVDLEKVGCV